MPSEPVSGSGAELEAGVLDSGLEGAQGSSLALGAMLREARLRLGLTLAEAASDTRINPTYLEALEGERWELLPAPVYARGFFRSYARYLGLAPEAIERLVPRHLPRPRDLEPVAGLRRRAAEAPLALPTLPALRLPGLALPKRSRRTSQPRERIDRVERVPRAREARASGTASARASLAPFAGRARRKAAGLRRAARGVESLAGLEVVRRLEPRTALLAGAGVLLAALALFFVLRLDGGGADPSAVAGPSGAAGQVAGPEPSPEASGDPPAPVTREGEMPDLAGLSRKDAETVLSRLGLTYVVIEVANPSVAPGAVFNHSPEAGKSIKRGDAVTLLVGRAP